jgi:O-antigen/teichoic acid export membrane protein
LGLFAPQSVVGVYFFAQSMVNQIFRVVTLNLSGVLLPALNKISHDPARQTVAFLRAARVVTLIGAPLCVGLGLSGSLFTRIFLDAHKWSALPPVLATLAVGMVFRLLDEPVQSLISAQGRFRAGFLLALGTGLSYIVTSALGSLTGSALCLALAVAAYYVVMGPSVLAVAIRVGGGSLADAGRVFYVPFLLALAAISPWLLLDRWLPGQGRARDALVLAAVIAGSSLTYIALGRLVRPAGWRELLDRLQFIGPSRLQPLLAWVGGETSPTPALSTAAPVGHDLRKL